MSGASGYDAMNGAVLGSDTFIKYIRQARSDPSVRAIVLRIDSPGGSAIASDAIWRELVITRDEKPHRPLVVSMSDLAASGGYYMAMASPYIVAQPGTLTGSIGVVGGKIVTGGTWAKAGANIEVVSQGQERGDGVPDAPLQSRGAREGAAGDGGLLLPLRRERRPLTAHDGREAPRRSRRDASGPGGRRSRSDWWTSSAASSGRSPSPSSAPGCRRHAEVQIVTYPPRRTLFEMLSESLQSQSRADAGLAAVLGPEERRVIGHAHRAGAAVPPRRAARGDAVRRCSAGKAAEAG